MQISNKFAQFESFPALFITSGEYEAHFYIAFDGKLELKEKIKMPPRENAKEKQAFEGQRVGDKILSSFTNRGRFIEDLKKKFAREVHSKIHDILAEERLEEIYIFAPRYVTKRIINSLDKQEQKKVRMQFYKEYTKENPIKLIEIFQKEIEKIQKEIMENPKKQILTT
ncbi:MAG: hypothetical protein ACD_5C00342G0001 [uncultured bacterium]|nr:MAG: hypothetical protein ACD_5C00342G0001 [uncultured bacterium]